MALTVPYNRNDWSNPLWDQREQGRETRRVSETSESSEEGWSQTDHHAGPSDESEDSVDQDEMIDSSTSSTEEEDEEEGEREEEEDDDDDDDDDDNDDDIKDDDFESDSDRDIVGQNENTIRFATVPKVRHLSDDEDDDEETTESEDSEEHSGTEEEETETDDSYEEEKESLEYWEEDEDFEEDSDDDSDDEEDAQIVYHHEKYPTEVFQSLEDFRHSDWLTDVFVSTKDGHTLHAHSPVLGAVSSVVLRKMKMQWEWSHPNIYISLEPGITHSGVAAVLEFAYTGCIPTLCKDTIDNIQAAARVLGVPRVVELCRLQQEEEKKSKEKEEKEKKEKEKELTEEEMNEEEEEEVEEEEEEEEEESRLSPAEELKITLDAMKNMWKEKSGCDIMLQADCRIFPAHRVVLAASSDYFRGMFRSGMKETRQWVVTLKSIGEEELEVFLYCAYSGSLVISWSWVFDLLCAAYQFQLEPALSLCLDFLHKEMDANSCLDVASFAEAYGLGDLLKLADDFVLRHFEDVSVTPKFPYLSRLKLLRFLKSNALCVPSEIVVLRAVMIWISACPQGRLRMSRDLINAIKFPLLTFKEFNEAQAIGKWPLRKMQKLYELMVDEFCTQEGGQKDEFREYLPKGNLVLVGGDGITPDLGNRRVSKELWFSNTLRNHTGIVKEVEWKRLSQLPEIPRYCHEVAVLDNKLYVCGGRHYYGEMDTMQSMFRYDPACNRWKRLADMQNARCLFSMVVLDRKIYVMGGERKSRVCIDSVEQYCPNTNTWSFVCPLDQPMSSHAATVWGGNIYISGGLNCEYQCLVSMFLYHPERGTTYLADMPHSRAQHRMECLGDFLYVFGGLSSDADNECVDQLACERYSPDWDCWYDIAPLPVPHVGAASAIMEEKLYILGGYSQMDYGDCDLIHRYDPAIERWENMGEVPGPKTEIRGCLLHLPENFRA